MSTPPIDVSSSGKLGLPISPTPGRKDKVGTLAGTHSTRELTTSDPLTPQEKEAKAIKGIFQSHVTEESSATETRDEERHIEKEEKIPHSEGHVEGRSISSTHRASMAPSEAPHPGKTAKQLEVENGLEPQIPDPAMAGHTIAARMTELKVPGVSVAVVDDGKVVWTQGYGTLDSDKHPGVLTQAGSISKVVTSLTILSLIESCRQTTKTGQPSALVEGKRFDLDSDIRDFLGDDLMAHLDPEGSTKIPGQEITIRRLLSHTAGIPGGGSEYYNIKAIDQHIQQVQHDIRQLQDKLSSHHAPSERSSFDTPFDGKERAEDIATIHQELEKLETLEKLRSEAVSTPIPNVDDIVEGRDPKLGPIQVRHIPGTKYEYSNLGYTILQKFIETVTGKPFATVAQEQVLTPLGMTDSTYSPPIERTTEGNGFDGTPLPESWRTIPHSAAGGLWTTAKDLAQVALGIQGAIAGRPLPGREAPLISPELAREMMTGTPTEKGYGLGLGIDQQAEAIYFAHDGKSHGFRTLLIANGTPNRGQGVVVLTNSLNGEALYPEIVKSVAQAYNWPNKGTLSICQPEVKPTELFPVPTDLSDPHFLQGWATRVQGRYGYWAKEEDVGNPDQMQHTVDLVFHEEKGQVFAKADGGRETGGRTLTLIPLGPDVAYHRPDSEATLEMVRFGTDEKTGKRFLDMFHAKHIQVD